MGRRPNDSEASVGQGLLARGRRGSRNSKAAGFIVDENLDVVEFVGRTGPYLELQPGPANLSLRKIVRLSLRRHVLQAIRQVQKTGKEIGKAGLKCALQGNVRKVNLRVAPIWREASGKKHWQVLFEEAGPAGDGFSPNESRGTREPKQKERLSKDARLRRQLQETRGHFQSLFQRQEEQHRFSLAKLTSANRVLEEMSAELEEAKVENETAIAELSATNQELQERVEERRRAERQLRDAQAELGRVLTSVSDALWSAQVEADGVLTYHYISPVIEKVTGRPPEFFLQGMEAWFSIVHADDRARVESKRRRIGKGRSKPRAQEYRIVSPDGGIRWVRDSINSTPLDNDRLRLDGVLSDVTEQKQAEEELARFRAAMDEAQEAILIVDAASGEHVDVNKTACGWLGYQREELLGLKAEEFIIPFPGGTQRVWRSFIREVRQARAGALQRELEFRRKDGSVFPVEVNLSVRDFEGRENLLLVAADITERRRVHEALRRERDFSSSVLGSVTAEIAVLDRSGCIIMVNDAWKRFAEKNGADEATRVGVGINYPELCRNSSGAFSEGAQAVAEGIEAVLEGSRDHFGHEYSCPSEFTDRWFLLSVSPLRTEEGGAVVSHLDITARKRVEEALRESEEKWRSLVEYAPDFILLLDREGTIQFVNRTVPQFSREEIVGKKSCEFVIPGDRGRWWNCFQQVLRTGKPAACELRGLGADRVSWYSARFSPVLRDGEVNAVTLVSTDITEQKRVEERLASYGRRQAAMAELRRVALAGEETGSFFNEVVRLVARTLDVEFCKLLRLQPDEKSLLLEAGVGWSQASIGNTVFEAAEDTVAGCTILSGAPVVVEDAETDQQFRTPQLLIDHGVASRVGVVIRGREGPFGVLAVDTKRKRTFVEDEIHFLEEVAGSIADFIERKRADDELRAERDYSAAIIKGSPLVICGMDPEGRLTFVNPESERVTGCEAWDLVGKNWWEVFSPSHGAVRQDPAIVPLKQTGLHSYEMVTTGRAGTKRTVLWNWINRWDAEGNLTEIIGFGSDITYRKQLEEQLHHSQKMEALGRLAGGLAHDFNNILTVISGYCDLIMEDLDRDHPIHGDVEEIRRAGERAAELTGQLLALSRQQMMEPRRISLNTVVTDTEKMLQRLLGEDIELVTRLDPTVGSVVADSGQIQQVILNLAVNSRDAMPEGGKLIIETTEIALADEEARRRGVEPGRYVRLTVSDTGAGMDEETQSRIFEPFFTTKDEGRGTGLGLSMVYGIVHQSLGGIWVESDPGKGTTFRICFPRVAGEAEPRRAAPSVPFQTGGKETILLVEDEESVRNLTRGILEQAGYHVLAAVDGNQALQIASETESPIDLLLSDLVMPGMRGQQLAKRVAEICPEIRVLYMSGYADQPIPQGPFLPKPFSSSGLLSKVHQVLALGVEVPGPR